MFSRVLCRPRHGLTGDDDPSIPRQHPQTLTHVQAKWVEAAVIMNSTTQPKLIQHHLDYQTMADLSVATTDVQSESIMDNLDDDPSPCKTYYTSETSLTEISSTHHSNNTNSSPSPSTSTSASASANGNTSDSASDGERDSGSQNQNNELEGEDYREVHSASHSESVLTRSNTEAISEPEKRKELLLHLEIRSLASITNHHGVAPQEAVPVARALKNAAASCVFSPQDVSTFELAICQALEVPPSDDATATIGTSQRRPSTQNEDQSLSDILGDLVNYSTSVIARQQKEIRCLRSSLKQLMLELLLATTSADDERDRKPPGVIEIQDDSSHGDGESDDNLAVSLLSTPQHQYHQQHNQYQHYHPDQTTPEEVTSRQLDDILLQNAASTSEAIQLSSSSSSPSRGVIPETQLDAISTFEDNDDSDDSDDGIRTKLFARHSPSVQEEKKPVPRISRLEEKLNRNRPENTGNKDVDSKTEVISNVRGQQHSNEEIPDQVTQPDCMDRQMMLEPENQLLAESELETSNPLQQGSDDLASGKPAIEQQHSQDTQNTEDTDDTEMEPINERTLQTMLLPSLSHATPVDELHHAEDDENGENDNMLTIPKHQVTAASECTTTDNYASMQPSVSRTLPSPELIGRVSTQEETEEAAETSTIDEPKVNDMPRELPNTSADISVGEVATAEWDEPHFCNHQASVENTGVAAVIETNDDPFFSEASPTRNDGVQNDTAETKTNESKTTVSLDDSIAIKGVEEMMERLGKIKTGPSKNLVSKVVEPPHEDDTVSTLSCPENKTCMITNWILGNEEEQIASETNGVDEETPTAAVPIPEVAQALVDNQDEIVDPVDTSDPEQSARNLIADSTSLDTSFGTAATSDEEQPPQYPFVGSPTLDTIVEPVTTSDEGPSPSDDSADSPALDTSFDSLRRKEILDSVMNRQMRRMSRCTPDDDGDDRPERPRRPSYAQEVEESNAAKLILSSKAPHQPVMFLRENNDELLDGFVIPSMEPSLPSEQSVQNSRENDAQRAETKKPATTSDLCIGLLESIGSAEETIDQFYDPVDKSF